MVDRVFLRNSLFNLIGQAAPLLAGVVAMPPLVRLLGPERLGVLALAWGVLGYFSLFDLGLGRALTQRVAERVGAKDQGGLAAVVFAALALMAAIGAIGGLVAYAISPWLVTQALSVSDAIVEEAVSAFRLIAIGIPVLVITAGLRGALEGVGMFAPLNAIRIPIGVLTFVAPLAVAYVTTDVMWLTGTLVFVRVASLLAHFILCRRVMPDVCRPQRYERAQIGPLLRFGGWMTVSNVIGPLMVYFDRFLIGAVVSMAAVTYYVVPYEIITKLWIVPAAVVSVMFPGFASVSRDGSDKMEQLYGWGAKVIFVGVVPLTLLLMYLAPELFRLWIGDNFAPEAGRVAQWLAIGVLVSSLAQVPFALLQGVGRPDSTAKLHLIELPFYLALLYVFATSLGIEGAAIAWSARVTVDALLLAFLARRYVAFPGAALRVGTVVTYLGFTSLWALAAAGGAQRIAALAVSLFVLVPITWFAVLNRSDRSRLVGWLRSALATRRE